MFNWLKRFFMKDLDLLYKQCFNKGYEEAKKKYKNKIVYNCTELVNIEAIVLQVHDTSFLHEFDSGVNLLPADIFSVELKASFITDQDKEIFVK